MTENDKNLFVLTVVVDEPKIGKYIEGYLLFRDRGIAEKFVLDNPPAPRAMFEDDTGGNAFGPPPGIVSYENLTGHIAPADFIEKFDEVLAENDVDMAFVETLTGNEASTEG